jgi:hypothetical protein
MGIIRPHEALGVRRFTAAFGHGRCSQVVTLGKESNLGRIWSNLVAPSPTFLQNNIFIWPWLMVAVTQSLCVSVVTGLV